VVLIAFFDARRNKAHIRKSGHVEKDLATQIIIKARGVYIHGFRRDRKVCPAPGWPIKVDLDAALERFELAGRSRSAYRIDPKAHMGLGRVDVPGRTRLRRDRRGDEREGQQRASETFAFAHGPATPASR
jgi:hypothetical protein